MKMQSLGGQGMERPCRDVWEFRSVACFGCRVGSGR